MTSSKLDVLQGTLELLILRSLHAAGELHGFGILDWIRSRTDEAIDVEDGALYHALQRMRDRDWVESEWGVSEKGRRARYYRLSTKGKRELRAQDERWERYVEAVARLGRGEAPA